MIVITVLAIASFATTAFGLDVISAGKFPESFAFAQAYYNGDDHVYVIGGVTNNPEYPVTLSSSIWRYNVVTGDKVKVTQFPTGVAYGSIGSSPRMPDKFFYLGGRTDTTFVSSDIHSVDLATLQIQKIGSLPHGVISATSVSDGQGSIYVFGGRDPNARSILQYDTEKNVVISHGNLPVNFTDGMAGWVDESAYILGGTYYSTLKQISKFTPKANSTSTVEVLPVELPNPQNGSGSVTVGHYIYLVGGQGYGHAFRLTRFDTKTYEIHTENLKLPRIFHYGVATVYVEKLNRIYLFGGYQWQTFMTLPVPFIHYVQL